MPTRGELLEKLDTVFSRRGWLAQEDKVFRDTVIARGILKDADKGEPLFFASDGPGGIYGLVSGSLGAFAGMADQEPMLGHIHRPGAWLGEGPALTGEPRFLSVTALEASRILLVPRFLIQQMELEGIAIRERVARQSWWAQTQAMRAVYDLLIPEAPRRIAAVLFRATGHGELPQDHLDGFAITQVQIAQMANCSRSMVSRTLMRLQDEGSVSVRYNRIAIRDQAALVAFAYSYGAN